MILALDQGVAGVIGAAISAIAVVTGGFLQLRKLRRENTEQHLDGQLANQERWDAVMQELGKVGGVVDLTRDEVKEGLQVVDGKLVALDKRVTKVETGARWERAEILEHVDNAAEGQ